MSTLNLISIMVKSLLPRLVYLRPVPCTNRSLLSDEKHLHFRSGLINPQGAGSSAPEPGRAAGLDAKAPGTIRLPSKNAGNNMGSRRPAGKGAPCSLRVPIPARFSFDIPDMKILRACDEFRTQLFAVDGRDCQTDASCSADSRRFPEAAYLTLCLSNFGRNDAARSSLLRYLGKQQSDGCFRF
jgi:hypothetical protein